MQATLELDMLSVVMMFFAIALASRSVQTNPRNRWYILSAFSLLVLLGTELFAYQVDDVGVAGQIFFHRATNVLGFSLSPVVCFFLLHFIGYYRVRKLSPVMVLPLILNAMFSLASYWTGWAFFVDEQNIYRRGPFFFVSTSITLFYYGLSILYLVKSLPRYNNSDRLLLICILTTPILGFIVQMLYPWVLTLWPSVALSLLLFYLFFLEQRYSIDTLTGLRNRTMFMHDILDLQHGSRDVAAIVVLDVNYLKKANDTYGHKAGDELLVHAGSLIERCFRGLGKVYRVGGDEFAVVSTKIDDKEIERALVLLDVQIQLANTTRTIKLSLASGTSWCESCIGNLFNTYVAADNAMYRNKEAMKRRPSDG
ncbi:MAG: diguanylate cyclase [Sphaerochaeta sp.]|uniref:GGDEF domain-containing protein n=1 Tax=Sphaerochaeta sp. TaxID=1972642 RepID=UPI0025911F35|nr:GGDEF domain-containing protein [Sphaerochaeta sp.]MDD2395769.1 diguanylate cyclase [Sphaerochaeta sp.]MDD4037183.1 diguanylate cyclase [Sphaerochaeta sp.]